MTKPRRKPVLRRRKIVGAIERKTKSGIKLLTLVFRSGSLRLWPTTVAEFAPIHIGDTVVLRGRSIERVVRGRWAGRGE